MKEIERIAIKKIHRISNEEYQKYLNSLSEKEKEELIGKINDDIKKEIEINSFDLHINKYYESMNGCNHEYAIYNGKDNFCGLDCLCLDCGEYIDKKDVKKVLFSMNDEKLEDIRKRYVELLMNNSVCDSFTKTFSLYSK